MICITNTCLTSHLKCTVYRHLRCVAAACLWAPNPLNTWQYLLSFLCLYAVNAHSFVSDGCIRVMQARGLEAYSISCGQSLLYNNIFPKHKDRLPKRMSSLVQTVAKTEIHEYRNHFDVVVACEDEEGEDMDVPLVSIKFRDWWHLVLCALVDSQCCWCHEVRLHVLYQSACLVFFALDAALTSDNTHNMSIPIFSTTS